MFRTLGSVGICLLMLPAYTSAGTDPVKKISRSEYIDTWKDAAMKEMREHGVPASITLAQGILESGDGNSRLAREGNNHFGIKCHDWTGKKMYHDDDARGECFRKYKNAQESYHDHSIFLKRARYAFLFDLKPDDYKGWAHGLKKAGYATNPKYPELLIRIIEENNLMAYDAMVLGKSKPAKPSKTREGADDEIVVQIGAGPPVFLSDNQIKYMVADERITVEALAKKLQVGAWQIRKYNDLDKGAIIDAQEKVYLQPKRNRSATQEWHTIAEGESLRSISQMYGVKMKRISKMSGLDADAVIKPGDKLRLR